MTTNEQWEDEQADKEIAKLEAAAQRRQQKAYQGAAQQSFEAGIAEALTEAGLNPADFPRILMENPEVAIKLNHKAAKKFAAGFIEKVAIKRNLVKDPKSGKFIKVAEGAPQGNQSRPSDLKSIAAQRQAGKLTSDGAMDQMIDTVLGDFFRATMSK